MQLPAQEIARIIGASTEACGNDTITTLLTDSRDLTVAASTMFFALRTIGNDGHNFIQELYARGVRYFVVDHEVQRAAEMPGAWLLKVDDVLDALQRLARHVRSLFEIPVVGITGSRGKTVVKEQISCLLRGLGINVVRSPRSYNSQIGVPLSIWEMDADTRVAVFEAGISRPGEMQRLREMIRPTVGVFTCLTDEHSEGFASLEEKATEKVGLFAGCGQVYVLRTEHTGLVESLVRRIDPAAGVECAGSTDGELSAAVASDIARWLNVPDAARRIADLVKEMPRSVSPRMDVTETLKNCLVVYDGFTFDARSLVDSVVFAHRHLTPGRKLTVVLPYMPEPSAELVEILVAKGVKRLVTVERPLGADALQAASGKIRVEHRDYFRDPAQLTISDFANEVVLVKGGHGTRMEQVRSMLEAPRHETVMEIDLGAITRNFNMFRSKVRPTTGIVAMVKAAGYGVGSLELAKTLQNQGAAYLAVAVIDEGVELRRAGITMPIIVMNPIGTNYSALFDNRIEPSVFSLHELDLLLDNAIRLGQTEYPVHIKLDTGMHRLGFLEHELPQLAQRLGSKDALKVASIFSHLATADCLDQDEYTKMQLETFDVMSESLIGKIPYRVKRHVLNTAGILRYPEYQYDMVRLGIGLYGVAPIPGVKLETVARLITTIISIKEWDEGVTIGYGRKGVVKGPSVIATIPVGYADGLNRHLSNGVGQVLVNGRMCPIIGNICMDQCMVDVTGADARLGDTVEIFGPGAPVTRLSDALGTIPYEILTSVSPRVKRIYFRE